MKLMSSRIAIALIRIVTGGIFFLGICSILTTISVSQIDIDSLLSIFGFTLYFIGVPVSFVWHSNWGFGAPLAISNVGWAVLNCVVTFLFGVWSDRILQNLHVKTAAVFLATLCSLCALNAYLSFVVAQIEFGANFGENWALPSKRAYNPSILFISTTQSLLSLIFFWTWSQLSRNRKI
jgi:hypothetical protein